VLTSDCDVHPVDWEAFVAALRVELGAEGYRVDQNSGSPAPIVLSIEAAPCEANVSNVEIVVNGPPSGRFTRTISLGDVAPALRARTAAIASAELVLFSRKPALAGRTETLITAQSPLPAPAPPPPAPPPPVVIVLPPPPARPDPSYDAYLAQSRHPRPSVLRLVGVAGEFTHYSGPASSLFGGRVMSEWRLPWNEFAVRVDLAGATGGFDTELGHVTLWTAAAMAGGEWILTGTNLAAAVGPMMEVGYTRVIGRASANADQGAGGGSTFAAVLLASLRFRVAGDLWAALELDGGGELSGIRALIDNQSAGSTAGALLAARLGAAYSF
jgi:hypothetical protein